MDRNVQLTLTGIQQDPEGGETVTELSTEAEYFEQNSAVYILYEEHTEDGGLIKSRIKLKNLLLEVARKGAMNTYMAFEAGREHMTEYTTPSGTIHMGILTHSVTAEPSKDELTITADYSLTASGEEISRCKISIKIHDRI